MNYLSLKQDVQGLAPGLGIACITGLAAMFLSEHYQAPAMLFALLLGMAVSFLYESNTKCVDGIEFSAKMLLRIGVALLGLRIALSDLAALGWTTFGVIVLAIVSTILLGVILSKVFKLSKTFGALTGGSVAICGASAALAISSILPGSENRDRDTLLTVICVTAFSTIAMIAYPILVKFLNFDTTEVGIFLGATIHDVAQVVGAGYSVSIEAGDLATLTKLVRVAMLLPVVLAFTIILKYAAVNALAPVKGEVPQFPGFLIGFIVLMLINSFVDLPPVLISSATEVSRFFLIVAITAIGMKSNLGKLTEVGLLPVFLILAETFWIAALILTYIYIK